MNGFNVSDMNPTHYQVTMYLIKDYLKLVKKALSNKQLNENLVSIIDRYAIGVLNGNSDIMRPIVICGDDDEISRVEEFMVDNKPCHSAIELCEMVLSYPKRVKVMGNPEPSDDVNHIEIFNKYCDEMCESMCLEEEDDNIDENEKRAQWFNNKTIMAHIYNIDILILSLGNIYQMLNRMDITDIELGDVSIKTYNGIPNTILYEYATGLMSYIDYCSKVLSTSTYPIDFMEDDIWIRTHICTSYSVHVACHSRNSHPNINLYCIHIHRTSISQKIIDMHQCDDAVNDNDCSDGE